METLSERQKRLFSSLKNSCSFDAMAFLKLVEHFSACFEEDNSKAVFIGETSDLGEVLDVLLLIGEFLEIDVGTAVQRKYRDKCPRCLKKPCICWNKKKKPAYMRYKRELPDQPYLSETQYMLDDIFPHRHTLKEEIQRVRDEIAELAEAFLRNKGQEALEEECADVFAWLCRVANTLGISLDEQRPL